MCILFPHYNILNIMIPLSQYTSIFQSRFVNIYHWHRELHVALSWTHLDVPKQHIHQVDLLLTNFYCDVVGSSCSYGLQLCRPGCFSWWFWKCKANAILYHWCLKKYNSWWQDVETTINYNMHCSKLISTTSDINESLTGSWSRPTYFSELWMSVSGRLALLELSW